MMLLLPVAALRLSVAQLPPTGRRDPLARLLLSDWVWPAPAAPWPSR